MSSHVEEFRQCPLKGGVLAMFEIVPLEGMVIENVK